MVWSATWLLLYRPQWEAKRVQRRKGYVTSQIGEKGIEQVGCPKEWQKEDGKAPRIHEIEEKHAKGEKFPGEIDQQNELRRRTLANGDSKVANGHIESNGTAEREKIAAADDGYEYYWQSYPDNLSERIPWVLDLLMNFRGPGWNWAIPPMPDIPPSVKMKLGESTKKHSSMGLSSTGMQHFTTRRELFKSLFPKFVIGYFLEDLVKVLMMKDPYYIYGPNTYALPPHLASLSPVQLAFFRLCLMSVVVVVSLELAFGISPLILGVIIGPKVLGLRGEPWYYPSTWGSLSNISNKGLNGLWGGWWHQMFRFIFAGPSNYLINNGYVRVRTTTAKITALLFAFGISGFLHYGGSISQLPKTQPWNFPIFFWLQGLGVLIQSSFCDFLHPQISNLPKVLRQTGNVIFTLTWLYLTAWWLIDDFSRGGMWLYEPIPISPLRGLGFGVPGDGWWCWEHIGVGWYTGKHWWESGIAL